MTSTFLKTWKTNKHMVITCKASHVDLCKNTNDQYDKFFKIRKIKLDCKCYSTYKCFVAVEQAMLTPTSNDLNDHQIKYDKKSNCGRASPVDLYQQLT